MSRRTFALAIVLASLLAACGSTSRVMSAPRVTAIGPVLAATALAPETGTVVAVYFGLADEESSSTDILFEVSRGSGEFVALGTSEAAGSIAFGGDGLVSLSAPLRGIVHRILWKPPANLSPTESVRLRLTPFEPKLAPPPVGLEGLTGVPITSAPFQVGSLAPDRS